MGKLTRYENCGAVFTDDLCCLTQWKQRGGTVNGTGTTIVKSPMGKAVNTNGTGYLTLTNSKTKSCNFVGGGSVSFWLYLNAANTGYYVVLGTPDTAAPTSGWLVGLDNTSAITFYTAFTTNRKACHTTPRLTPNAWYHIALTYTPTAVATLPVIYINGIEVVVGNDLNGTGTMVPSTTGKFSIGSDINGNAKTNVRVKNIMYFNRILTLQEIQDIYNNHTFDYEKHLVSKWDLSDINPIDSGWRKLNINGTGTNLDSTNIVAGHNSKYKAISFNGTDEKITTSGNTGIGVNGEASIIYWAKLNMLASVAAKHQTFSYPGIYNFNSNNYFYITDTNDNFNLSSYITKIPNKWHLYSLTYNGNTSTALLYFDTNKINVTISDTPENIPAINNLIIGDYSTGRFNGSISQIRIYNKQLTQMQIADIYNKTK